MTPSPSPTETKSDVTSEASGFPLAALFLLTAFCSVLAALAMQYVRAIITSSLEVESVLVASVIGALVGLGLGSLLGLAQRGPVTGMFISGPTGFVLGATIGPLCLVPMQQLNGIMGISIGGSVLLIVLAVVIRVISSNRGVVE